MWWKWQEAGDPVWQDKISNSQKNFVKSTLLVTSLVKYWFHEIFVKKLWESISNIFKLCWFDGILRSWWFHNKILWNHVNFSILLFPWKQLISWMVKQNRIDLTKEFKVVRINCFYDESVFTWNQFHVNRVNQKLPFLPISIWLWPILVVF